MDTPIGGGLLELPHDDRDFVFGELFTLPPLSEIPHDFSVAQPLEIKDQGDSDLCTAFAVTSVSEDQEGVRLSPEYQFQKTKKLMGDFWAWGADLRTACKAAVEFGSLPAAMTPESLRLREGYRNQIANWENWSPALDTPAKKQKKDSYFSITPAQGYDLFDTARAMLWKNRAERRTIVTGTLWQNEWTNAEGGVIQMPGTPAFGHAFKIFGAKGEYLKAQLSNGTSIGDHGIFYFHRSVVNALFTYGMFTFKDIPPEVVKHHVANDLKLDDPIPPAYSFLQALIRWFQSFLRP